MILKAVVLSFLLMQVLASKDSDILDFENRFERVGIIIPKDDRSAVKFRIGDDVNLEKPQHEVGVSRPEFCHDLECPKFKVVKKTEGYEERLYDLSNWMSTSYLGVALEEAQQLMFYRLFKYIQGNNEKKKVIPMTAPVLISIIPGQGPTCADNFTMSFYMTSDSNPKPTDSTVFPSALPQQRVFVKSFGGFANTKKWLAMAEELSKELAADGVQFESDFFYSAGYDSPFKLLNRHNEVWFLAKK